MEKNFNDHELTNVFNIIRSNNISNKKSYTFICSELEYFFNNAESKGIEFKELTEEIFAQKNIVIGNLNRITKILNDFENSLLDIYGTGVKKPHSENLFQIDKIYQLSNESKMLFNDVEVVFEKLTPSIKDEIGKNIDLLPLDNFIQITLEKIYNINKVIISNQNDSINIILNLTQKINDILEIDGNSIESYYKEKFKNDTQIIIKSFENKISNLTSNFENKIKNLNIDQDKISNSSQLLVTNIDNSFNDLTKLTEKTQELELILSKRIGEETNKIKNELDEKKNEISYKIQNIISSLKNKINEIETTHSNFISLVENAGIYNLTENYNNKSEEEKIEYKNFRKYTSWSIIAAIISTLLIFLIAFLEHYFSSDNNQTNYLLLASRLSISVMFFVLALYLSKQASKHYECYQENHRTFLQLAALEPFMARMTSEEQKEIRKELIPSYFNQGTKEKFASKGDEVDMSIVYTILDKVSNLMPYRKDTNNSENTKP